MPGGWTPAGERHPPGAARKAFRDLVGEVAGHALARREFEIAGALGRVAGTQPVRGELYDGSPLARLRRLGVRQQRQQALEVGCYEEARVGE